LGGGDVLVFDGNSWSLSFDGSQKRIIALAVYNGKLYAGQGVSTDSGDVLVFDGNSWSTSYDGSQERIQSLAVFNGKLYAGQGVSKGDGDILVLNAGNMIESGMADWNKYTSVSLTKDNKFLSLYVNGELQSSVPADYSAELNKSDLLIGKLYGSGGIGRGEGIFNGTIDEVSFWNGDFSESDILKSYQKRRSPNGGLLPPGEERTGC
jgi:hypothetical protein